MNPLDTVGRVGHIICSLVPKMALTRYQMEILVDTSRILAYSGLGIEQTVNIGGIHIPRAFIRVSIMSSPILFGIAEFCICVKSYAIGIQAILYPFHSLMINIMKLAAYSVLIGKTNKIAELIEYLQMVVDRREFLFINSKCVNSVGLK